MFRRFRNPCIPEKWHNSSSGNTVLIHCFGWWRPAPCPLLSIGCKLPQPWACLRVGLTPVFYPVFSIFTLNLYYIGYL
jgi:hypothetical protein